MKPRSKFLIGFLTAALTFGGLWTTLGPRQCHHYGHYQNHYYGHHHGCHNPAEGRHLEDRDAEYREQERMH